MAGLLVSIVFLIPQGEKEGREVQRDQLLEKDNEWIIQFDLINNEDEDINHTINLYLNTELYNTMPVLVRTGRTFTYIRHIYREISQGGAVIFAVYKEGQSAPFEETTYFVKFNEK
ncbi:hypothetical protein ACFLTS_06350 [Chloroflexota bacterium]